MPRSKAATLLTKNQDESVYRQLLFDLTEDDMCNLFKIFGEIVDCKLVIDPETGKSRGFGFVEFRGRKQAWHAMKQMNGVEIKGRHVAVTRSKSEDTRALKHKQRI